MNSEDRSTPFSCAVAVEISKAQLTVKGRKKAVQVLAMSREDFTIEVNKRVARKLKVGRIGELKFNGEHWRVTCTSNEVTPTGKYEVRLARTEDLIQLKPPRTSLLAVIMGNRGANTADPVVPLALTGVLLLAVLVLPGIGGEIGTSDAISGALEQVVTAVTEMFT